jgi:hypothetical protein
MGLPCELIFCEALSPRKVMALMLTRAMRATRRAYSTSVARRSSSMRDWSLSVMKL